MIGSAEISVVLLIAAGVVILAYWRRRHRSVEKTLSIQAGGDEGEATQGAAVQDAVTTPSQEITAEETSESKGVGQDPEELELTTEPADGEIQPLDEDSKQKALGKGDQPREAEPPANVDTHPETGSGLSVIESGTRGSRDTPVPGVSLRDGQVTQSCSLSATSEGETSAQVSVELTPEERRLATTEPTALDSKDETSEEPNVGEEVSLGAQEGEAKAGITTALPPETKLQYRNEVRRKPRRYEGPVRQPPRPRNNNRNTPRAAPADAMERERSLPIEVWLRFERGGSCAVSLIASRSPEAPEDITVVAASGPLDLHAMQDEWYQDVVPEDIDRILSEGAVWSQDGGSDRWSLSGRDLYVLGERSDLFGWVSQPSLKLGRQHVILCTEQLRPVAEEALREAGVDHPVALDFSSGSPHGWIVIRNVVPVRPVSPSEQVHIMNALRPLPEIEIYLEGGVRLEYTTWLEGYPPLVRVYGDLAHTSEVHIDGVIASCGDDGAYRVPTWDAEGTHTVWCAGTSKSYTITPFEASWEPWDAHAFSVAQGSSRRISICGPLVREAPTDQHDWLAAIQVPETNTVILGAAPGERTLATRASEVRGMPCLASPSFRPIWALPSDPLHSSKKTVRILFLGQHIEPILRPATHSATRRCPDVDAWSKLILDASRKGLAIEPDTECARTLWRRYRRTARHIWRSRK